MKLHSSRVSNTSWLKSVLVVKSRRGALIMARKSSKYSLSHLNHTSVRTGRIACVSGGRCWLSHSVLDRGNWYSRQSSLSLVNADMQVAIASGEIYLDWGIFQRWRVTRWLVDNSSFPNVRNGMLLNLSDCKHGADPPKNDLGRTGAIVSFNSRVRDVSAGNGFFIVTNAFNNKFCMPQILVLNMRLCCLSAVMILAIACGHDPMPKEFMTIGNAGQTSSIFFTGRCGVQRSCRFRWYSDANTMYCYHWHTYTNVCQASGQ